MATVDDALATQVRNIETRTGRSVDEWITVVRERGLSRHSEIVGMLKTDYGMSHGNANLIALMALKPPDAPEGDARIDAIYAGDRASLRPLHDAVIAAATSLGPDVEQAPKKSYVSLRRSKQFATVGPGPRGLLEIGLNLAGVEAAGRLEASSGMCTHRVRVRREDEFDAEARAWLRSAYERA